MKIKKTLTVILVIILAVLGYLNMTVINPKTLTVREETISTDKMADGKELIIAYFSDIQYAENHSNRALKSLADTINQFDPDIVIFGGDVFDYDEDNGISNSTQETVSNEFKNIHARLGKYAVLGDQDYTNQDNLRNLLTNAEFEILTNQSLTVYKDRKPLINLVGLEPVTHNALDVNELYQSLNQDIYTVSVCHTPDIFDTLNSGDLLLAGHTLNGQVYLPFISGLLMPEGGRNHYRGQTVKNNLTLDITSGVGTKNKDIRLFADAEIVVYKIK